MFLVVSWSTVDVCALLQNQRSYTLEQLLRRIFFCRSKQLIIHSRIPYRVRQRQFNDNILFQQIVNIFDYLYRGDWWLPAAWQQQQQVDTVAGDHSYSASQTLVLK